MKIGVFDSGIGGLTVLEELVKSFPNNEYIYLADMQNSPFGDKAEEEIRYITKKILGFMKEKQADIVICACGTISGISQDILNKFNVDNNIPTYDMTEGITEALKEKNNKKILLLATTATIEKGVFERNIKYTNDVKVICEACPEFVKLLESDIREEDKINEAVLSHLEKIKDEQIDSIILGCTHYGLLKDNIKRYIPSVDIFEAGNCLVKRQDLKYILQNNMNREKKCVSIYTTKISNPLEKMSKEVFNVKLNKIEI